MKNKYYVDDVGNEQYGIFNEGKVGNKEEGFCFALYLDKKQAKEKAKEMNHEK
jgi:hypothetical protein